MASTRDQAQKAAPKETPLTATSEELVPASGWTQDSDSHYLLLDLPGFEKEQVRLQVNNRGEIIASGERLVIEKKRIHFKQIFDIPENSISEKITGKFEDEVLYVTIPKHVKTERGRKSLVGKHVVDDIKDRKINQKFAKPECSNEHQAITNKEEDKSMLASVVKNLRDNTGIIITAVLAFSLGVLLSRKLRTI